MDINRNDQKDADQAAEGQDRSPLHIRMRRWFGRLGRRFVPGPRAWRGAAWGLLSGTTLIYHVVAYTAFASTVPNYVGLIVIAALALAAMIIGGLVVLLIRILDSLPLLYAWTFADSLCILLLLSMPIRTPVLAAAVVLALSLAGAGGSVLIGGGLKDTTITQRVVAFSGALLGSAAIVFGIVWLSLDGSVPKPVPDAAIKSEAHVAKVPLPDPSRAGPYRVQRLTYGSGTDRRRPEFGAKAEIKTGTVNGSKLLGNWEGRAGWGRTLYWGESVLVFALADAKDRPSERDKDERSPDRRKAERDKEKEKAKEPRQPINLTLEVTDNAGAKARLTLSHCAFLQPQIEAHVAKAEFMNDSQNSEVVFRSFEFPLASFVEVDRGLDPAHLKTIRFVFDRTKEGVVILDDLGFRSRK